MGVYDKELPEFLNADIDSILADFRSKPIAPYTPPPAPVVEDGEFVKGVKRGMEGLKSSAYGAAGLVGSGLGIDSLRDWGYKGFLEHEEEAAQHAGRVQNIEDIKSIGDVGDWATGTFGSLVPSIGEAAVTSAAGAIIGSAIGPEGTIGGAVTGLVGKQAAKSMMRKLAREYVKGGMERQIAKQAAKEAVESLPAKALMRNLGTKAGIVAGTAPIEAGAMWGEGMQQGKDNPYSAAVFGTLSGLSELVGGEAELIDIFTNPARQAVKGNIIKRIGMEMVKIIPQEAAQEAAQETLAIINRKLVDPSFDMFGEEARSRVLNSAAAGAIGGFAFGAAGGVKSKGPLTRATEAAVPPATPQPAMEPDPFQDEQPPHYSEKLEEEEQGLQGQQGAGSEGDLAGQSTGQQQVNQDGSSVGHGMGETDTVLSGDEKESAKPQNEQQRSTDELLLDEAREWAASSGKSQLMKVHGEPEADYRKRIINAYQNRDKKPPAQLADTGPKYASVQLVNPETGEIEIVRPEEAGARLAAGWRPIEQDVSPVTRHTSPITDLNTVTEKDRESLKSAMDRLQYWEHSGTDGGKSNREQLYPWLSSWPTTTPAEVGKAIGRFLEGKKLGEVQQRLVEAALEYERENSVPFDIAEETTEEDAPQAQSAPAEKTPLSGTVRAKAKAYAQSAGMDLDGATDEEIAAFVNKYRAWKWAKRQEEHLTKKIEKTREPKALERLGRSLAEATSRRKKLEPEGPVGGAEPITDHPSPITDVTPDHNARWAEVRRKHLLNKLAQEKEPRARERIRNTLARLEAKRVPRQEEAGEKGDAEKPASQNAPEKVFEGKAIPEPGPEKESEKHKATAKQWLLTAFDKRTGADTSADTTSLASTGDTARHATDSTLDKTLPSEDASVKDSAGAVPPASGEMSKAPSMVRDFAAKVLNGEDHPKRLVFKVTTETKRQKVINDTGVDIGGSVEMVLPDSIIHVKKRHLDITLDDWERLPEIAETFNVSYIGRAIGDPKTKRMIFVRESDPYQYVYVAEFASGGRGKRLIVKTYFKDTSKNVEDFLEKNAQKTKEASSGVGDLTQPALRPQNSTSSVNIVANSDGNVKENEGKIDDFGEKIGSARKGRLRQAEQGQQQSEQKKTVGEEKPVRFALRPDMSNKEALPGLVERGVNNYAPGMKFPDFAKRMKAELGELWERFKSMMFKVWHQVRAKFAEERGSLSREQREESLFPVDARAEEENFRKQLNDPDSNRRSLVEVGSTPKILVRLGAQQKPLYISRTTIEKITMPEGVGKGKHNLPIDVLDVLYRNLHDPVMVLESKVENIKAFVVVTEMFVNQGGRQVPVIAAIHINEQHGRNVINRVASVYGKDSLKWFENEILERRVVYRSKQKSPSWLMTAGLQLPRVRGAMKSLTGSRILTEDDVVKPKFAVTAEAYGIPAADIQAAFGPVYANLRNAPPWRVVQTAAELPKRALDDAARRGMPQRFLQAVYLGNEVVYVADHFSSIEEAKQVILEEVVVHHGLRAIMPRDAYEKHMLHAALWYANKRTEDWKALAEGYGLDLKTRAGRIEAAEEMIGRDARTGKNSTMLSRIIAAVKEFLRSIGFDVGYGEAEIRELLGKARRYIEGKEAPYEKEGEGGIDYGALLRKLREQGITDEQLQAFMAYQPGGGKFAAAWHGSPHDFEKFLADRIGTGEGAQAYGHGLYFAGNKEVAEYYKNNVKDWKKIDEINKRLGELSREMDKHRGHEYGKFKDQKGYELKDEYDRLLDEKLEMKGRLYQVELAPQEDEFLLWDVLLSEQSEKVRAQVSNEVPEHKVDRFGFLRLGDKMIEGDGKKELTGRDLYMLFKMKTGSEKAASEYLHALGIRGIKYLDGATRSKNGYILLDGKKITKGTTAASKTAYDAVSSAGGIQEGLDILSGVKSSDKTTAAARAIVENWLEKGATYHEGDYNYVIFSDEDVDIVAKFARGKAGGKPLSDVEFNSVLERVAIGLEDADRAGLFVPVESYEALPAAIRKEAQRQGDNPNDIEGAYHNGKVYLLRKNITSARRLEELIFHEWHGHFGLNRMFGAGIKKAMVDLYKSLGASKMYSIGRKYGINLMQYGQALAKAGYDMDTRRAIMTEEMLAHLTKEFSSGKVAAKVREIIGMIRDWLRRNGFMELAEYGETDIAHLLKQARAYARSGVGEKAGETIFARREAPDGKFALSTLNDVKSQITEKGVTLNTTEREVLEADRDKALEAINETIKDYDEPGRMLFRAFYEADQDQAPGVVPYNPERGHYAAGEDLKGSWWTTSLSTAQEIAWSKARPGKRVKVVALPVDKLPNGNVYIQNTNPPGFVYDLFVGLPSDVSMKDVREMPVDGGVRYALASDGLLRYTEQWGSAETWKSLVRLLNPLDWSRFREWIDEHTPVHIMNTIGHVLRTPVEAAEADKNKAPLVDTALDREKNKNSLILKLLGWFGGKEKPAGFVDRLTEQFTRWGNKDLSTAWGVIADNYAQLSDGDKKGVNLLIYRGDIDGKAWRTYDMVKDDNKLAENLPSEAAFQVYRDIRTHIDTVVADTIVAEMEKSAKENGMSRDEVEKHIFTFRNNMARHPGWMPRNHGEGDWQVNVYQSITGLKWEIGQYRAVHHYQFIKKNGGRVDFEKSIDALSAYLPYFPSKAVADEIKTLARRFGLAYEHESGTGRQRVYVDKGAEKRLGKAIAKLKKDLSVEGLPEKKRFELQGKLTGLEDALFFVKGNSPQKQIRFFVKQAAKIIGKLELQNSVNIRQAEENLEQAIKDKESAAEIKRLRDELKRLGDGSIKVKVYMKLQSSRSRANRHKKEVMADLKKAMPENYLDWAAYETRVDFNNRLTESTYGDMQNDFAMEQAQLQAVERAASKQDITKTEAAGIRHQIVQSLAEVLMARGAGAHRIQRAPYLIEGYDTENPIQAYQDYMTSTAGMISKAQYACAQFENFRYAKPEVKPWAEQYIRDTLRNMGAADRISANLRSVATLAYLGFKVSSMIINATQPWTLGIAELGKHTKQNSLVAIARAQKDIFKGELSAEEKEIFSSEIWKEQEQNTVIREMAGSGEGTTGKISGFIHTLTGKALFGFQEVEMLNRKTVILAAYRSFLVDKMEHAEALDKALRVNRRVNFEMSRANLPGFAQKPLGRTVYALQSFMWNNWNWVYNNLTSGKKEDMAAMLRYAAAMAIIGGAAALPGWDELDKLYQTLFGESPRLAFRKWTKQHARQYGTLGEMVNGFAWHGLASATGVNISNAMRLQIPIVSPLLSGDSLPEAAGGVFTGLAQKGGRAVTAASRGDWYRALENISPEALAGGMRAYRMATKGATTGTGKVIFDENGRPMKYGTGEAAVRMLGFQPSRIAERNDLTNVEKGLSAHWREQRGDLLAELRLSKPGQRKEVMVKIMKFNRRLRTSQANGLVPVIKTATIRRTLSDRPNKGKAEWQREQLSG